MGRFSTYDRGAGQGLSNFSDPLVSSPESDGSGGFLGFSRSPCSAPELLIEVINGKRNRPPGWCLYPELERPRYREEGTPLQSTPSGRPTFAGNGAEDPAEGFSGQFVQNTATMSWSVSSLGNVYQSAPQNTSFSLFAQVGHEHNGVFFEELGTSRAEVGFFSNSW